MEKMEKEANKQYEKLISYSTGKGASDQICQRMLNEMEDCLGV